MGHSYANVGLFYISMLSVSSRIRFDLLQGCDLCVLFSLGIPICIQSYVEKSVQYGRVTAIRCTISTVWEIVMHEIQTIMIRVSVRNCWNANDTLSRLRCITSVLTVMGLRKISKYRKRFQLSALIFVFIKDNIECVPCLYALYNLEPLFGEQCPQLEVCAGKSLYHGAHSCFLFVHQIKTWFNDVYHKKSNWTF